MTDEFEAAKKAGWIQAEHTICHTPEIETIIFTRPKQKPNAIVDWTELKSLQDNFKQALISGPRAGLSTIYPSFVEKVFSCIKKIDP